MAVEEAAASEDGERENYFVSMTDMMVGMLFIFIILLMSFALVFRKQADVHVNKIAIASDLGRNLEDLETQIEKRLQEIREASALRLTLLKELKTQLSREKLQVEISPSGDVLRLTEDAVRFALNDWHLDAQAKINVDKIARAMQQVLPRYAACSKTAPSPGCRTATQASVETVFIEGHTDENGLDEQNWILSAQRAESTYRELTVVAPGLRGILNRHDEQILSISGYSSTRPIDPARTVAAYRKNRRIDLRFVMDTDPRAGLEEINTLLSAMREKIRRLKGDGT